MPEEQPQQKQTNYWKYILIIGGVLTLLIAPIAYNKVTEKCALGKYEGGFCKFEIQENQVCDGTLDKNICVIDAKGDLENPKVIWTIFGLIGSGILIFLAYKYIRKPIIELEEQEYKKYNPKQARKEIEKYFVEEFDIPHQKTKKFSLQFWKESKEEITYPKETFEWYDHHQPFIKGNGEWFFQGQLQINNTIYAGVYTVLVSLARDIKDINEGLFRYSNTLFEYYKLDEAQKPYYQPRTQTQKIYERLIQLGREDLLTQFAEKEAEAIIGKVPTERVQPAIQQIPQQVPIQQPSSYQYQKRYYPYRGYRRY